MRCLYKVRQQSSSCSVCYLRSLLRIYVARALPFLFIQLWMCSKQPWNMLISLFVS